MTVTKGNVSPAQYRQEAAFFSRLVTVFTSAIISQWK
jgi:hypothetical protein